ncbi:MAG: R3H domain-containing nucleic acid-binding protein [Candidatus Staskawiczbacteria bacterium]|jgi:spoIIIJ-associated protein
MIDQDQIDKIKEAVIEFFDKMTIAILDINIGASLAEKKQINIQESVKEDLDIIDLDIKIEEPQILIGQQGQTLFELQRLLRSVLNKKFQQNFYLNLDIDGYKKKKIEYLKYLVKDYADQVSFNKEERELSPMSSYERRIVHAELAKRTDVVTESRGEGLERHIVIKPN